MSTIGGLSTSTSSSIRGYGGLASGLDRDTLIEGMTYGTTSKITQQQQKKQQLEWKQAAVRSISEMMISFANKYTSSWSSSTNLFSSVFWGRSNITTTGANSKYVSVTGTANASENIKIMGVKQLAKKASWSANTGVSDAALKTGKVSFDDYQNLKGRDLKFEVGGKSYTITLPADGKGKKADGTDINYNYTKAEDIAAAINEQLGKVVLEKDESGAGHDVTLKDKINVEVDPTNGTKINFTSKDANAKVKLAGGSAIGTLGINSSTEDDGKWTLNHTTALSGTLEESKLITKFEDRIAGRELTFSYNGTSKSVYMPSASELRNAGELADDQKQKIKNDVEAKIRDQIKDALIAKNPGLNSKPDELKTQIETEFGTDDQQAALKKAQEEAITQKSREAQLNTIKNSLQNQLNSVFGKDRVQVEVDNGGFKFTAVKTVKKGENQYETELDTSSTFSLTGGGSDLINNVLNTRVGESNRVNLSAKLTDAGFMGLTEDDFKETEYVPVTDKEGKPVIGADGKPETTERQRATIDINGTKIAVYADDTMNALMARINENTDLKVSYQAETDKFVFTSKEEGASGKVSLKGAVADAVADKIVLNGANEENSKKILNALFGTGASDTNEHGQDAIVTVKYAGSDEAVNITRGSNSFTVDGLTINLKGTFGKYDASDKLTDASDADAIEIHAEVNADSIVDGVKSMVEEYNAIIELVNKELTTKPDRDYSPLTSEQKKELSDDEIETWETKAKQGMLFGDSDIRGLSSDLRFIIGGGIAQELSEMGLSTSSTYSDNGKLVFDETKFRAALSKDPERVQEIFSNEFVTNTNGKGTSTGIATALKNVMDKYVNTMGAMESKGILIRKAGTESSPMSVTENTMYKQLAEIDKLIAKLQERLETERDRYIKQFTSLETLISQMNSQSSWLSQLSGY